MDMAPAGSASSPQRIFVRWQRLAPREVHANLRCARRRTVRFALLLVCFRSPLAPVHFPPMPVRIFTACVLAIQLPIL